MCSPRQDISCQTITSLLEAGFEIDFSPIYWTYATGFPKAQNVGKIVSSYRYFNGAYGGFQPKPAVEVILVAMKPMTEKKYALQAIRNGHGVTWLDDCRIPFADDDRPVGGYGRMGIGMGKPQETQDYNKSAHRKVTKSTQPGRFPANLLVSDNVLDDGRRGHTRPQGGDGEKLDTQDRGWGFRRTPFAGSDSGSYSRYFDLDAWFEKTFPFLIIPKPSRREKNAGLDGSPTRLRQRVRDGGGLARDPLWAPTVTKNDHPFVKPVKLMAYLIAPGSREGQTVLDVFAGSGSTGIAAKLLRRNFIGIEINKAYCEIAERRIFAA